MGARATLVAGLGFGDEGKGTVVDHLVRTTGARLVVRYNGGAQAAHNVVTPDGRHHTFAQIGSGTFAGARTFLSRFMLVNPVALVAEAKALAEKGVADPLATVAIDPESLVTTPYHVAMNRLRELARSARHGSCGMGIGETVEESLLQPGVLRFGDLRDRSLAVEKLAAVRSRMMQKLASFVDRLPETEAVNRELFVLDDDALPTILAERWEDLTRRVSVAGASHLAAALGEGDVIFEGAQGVLLDETFGFHPHTTWSTTTFANAQALLEEIGFVGATTRLGIVRAFATRHGAGPFVTEDRGLDRLSSHDHNRWGEWQGSFRSGPLDEVALRYAVTAIGGVDAVGVTNLDRLTLLGGDVPVSVAYEEAGARVTSIAPAHPPTLEGQERLGQRLLAMRPVLERVAVSSTQDALLYAERVAAVAGAPLAVASFGPTADEKVTFDAQAESHIGMVQDSAMPSASHARNASLARSASA